MNDFNPADAGLVRDPRTGLRGIKDAMTGETLWYQGNCRDCGAALYGRKSKRSFWCDACLLPPVSEDHGR